MKKVVKKTAAYLLIAAIFVLAALGIMIVQGHANWLPGWALVAALVTLSALCVYFACLPRYFPRGFWRQPSSPKKFTVVDKSLNRTK
ncbi:MAG: hypothetical protein JNL18_02255 [Planctomycetaceae bacterium]|jgi:membrane protein YdbS with pleckstrin-like domain|nr:hypothetical protein [Planctomycetaceae bacterium]